MDYPTIADVIRAKAEAEIECATVAGMYRVGTVGGLEGLGGDLYLYVEAGGRGMLKIRYVSRDLWVTTDGNGGFGQSWCCCSDTPVYRRK